VSNAHADPADYAPVFDAVVETLDPGERMVVTSTPDGGETVHVDCVAASKYQGLTYEIRADGRTRYGQAGVPPTDVDDLAQTFIPALEFDSKLRTIVRNPSQKTRVVAVQVRGWEPA
jgi:hypothetical protein